MESCCDGPSAQQGGNDSDDGWDESQISTSIQADDWKAAFEDIVRQDEAILQRRRRRNNEKMKGKYGPTKLGIIATDSSDSTSSTAAVSPSASVDWSESSACEELGAIKYFSQGKLYQAQQTSVGAVIHDGKHFRSVGVWLRDACGKRV